MSKQNHMPEGNIIARHTDNMPEPKPKALTPMHWILLLVCVLSAALLFGIGLNQKRQHEVSLQEQLDEIARLDSQIEVQRAANSEKEIATVMNITGLDRHRVEQDDARAERFFTKVLTWEDYETYSNNREELIYEYDLDSDSNFLSVFYPPVHNQVDENGVSHNKIDDQGINMRYESIDSHVCSITGDVYSYIAEVTYSSLDETYNYRGSGKAVVLYTIDGSGNITGLDAYGLDT